MLPLDINLDNLEHFNNKKLRPEFVSKYPKALNTDSLLFMGDELVFNSQAPDSDEAALIEAGTVLREKTVKEFVSEL